MQKYRKLEQETFITDISFPSINFKCIMYNFYMYLYQKLENIILQNFLYFDSTSLWWNSHFNVFSECLIASLLILCLSEMLWEHFKYIFFQKYKPVLLHKPFYTKKISLKNVKYCLKTSSCSRTQTKERIKTGEMID